jgi:hypothetical protein
MYNGRQLGRPVAPSAVHFFFERNGIALSVPRAEEIQRRFICSYSNSVAVLGNMIDDLKIVKQYRRNAR